MAPPVLYRYRRLNENTLRHLERGEVYFQSPLKFNDPFEVDLHCEFRGSVQEASDHFESFVKYELTRVVTGALRGVEDPGVGYLSRLGRETSQQGDVEPVRAKLRALARDDVQRANQVIGDFWNKRKQTYGRVFGVCCFSASHLDALMWAHYADEHRGICLIFDTHERPAVDWKRYAYHAVEYTSQRSMNVLDAGYTESLRRMLLTKAEHWKYEQEWRLISARGEGMQVSSNRNLLGLILGLRIADNAQELRQRLLQVLGNFTVLAPDPWSRARRRARVLSVQQIVKDAHRYAFDTAPIADLKRVLGLT